MKITLIATVLNEEKTIKSFIVSIVSQTRLPDELIIVDGGSRDQTVAEMKSEKLKIKIYNLNFKILVKKGNRAVGRNEAIKNAKGEIILCSDSGCVLDKDWVKNIIEPFKDKSVGAVAGYYKGKTKSIFEKCLIPYVLVMEDKITPEDFLPAARSMAFKKSVWKKIGGFDEKYSHNEDYVFANKLKFAKAKIVFAKNAVVYWIPRKNITDAFRMFFRFALGDGESGIFREKVIFIFVRYLLGFYILFLSFIEKTTILIYELTLGFLLYIIWAIKKNYKYIGNVQALFYLPILQFVSDFAVLTGATLGFVKSISIKDIPSIVLSNKSVSLIIAAYAALMLVLIDWGIPNKNHPFSYFMDEWHQAQSVRTTFAMGSPNVSGSANGSMFHFFLSGLYLVPFITVGVFDPFSIKSYIDSLEMQGRLFELLRLNTLSFGVFGIILIAYIAKKYLKLNPFLASFLFAVNPIFLTLSNYFKYDIALVFWILLSFLFFLEYISKPNRATFFLAAFFSGIALSVKLSAIPLLPILICAFLLFNKDKKKKFRELAIALIIFFCTFLLFGIPDLLLGKGSIFEYLYDNLIRTPAYSQNYTLGMPYWQYLLTKGVPSAFGTFLFLFFIFGFLIAAINIFKKGNFDQRKRLYAFIVISLLFFILSLVPLRIEARGNRLLVLLPFMALLGALFLKIALKTYSGALKKFLIIAFVLFLSFQTAESLSWQYIKLKADPRQKSSEWIKDNIPAKSTIGIENIPIYQFLPDIILKEFYFREYSQKAQTKFNYKIIDNSAIGDFPSYVVIANERASTDYLKYSPKKYLVEKLKIAGYKKVFTAASDFSFLKLFRNERDYFISGLVQSPNSISIYKKP